MSKISVILATFNEEKNIKDCLESVHQWVDEIVIVDGTSIDKTVEIAKKYTDKIFIKENPPMFHINKQLAIEKATGDWIFYLDADERVTPELRKEILRVIATRDTSEESPTSRRGHHPRSHREETINGFWIPRKNIIFGKWIQHTGWWPDYQLRLFRRGKSFLPCQSVHEQPQLTGKAGYLKTPLVHYNYRTISQFIDKLNLLYTENDKNVFLAKKEKLNLSDFISRPAGEFLKRFFKEQGYKDGLHGLVLSLLQTFSTVTTLAKVWEQQGFPEIQPNDFVQKVEKESRQVFRQAKYWFLTEEIKNTSNFFQKIYYRIKRKMLL